MRACIDVPEAAAVLIAFPGRVAPAGVRDYVAVLAEKRLDGGKNVRMGDGLLRQRRSIEHLIAEIFVLFRRTVGRALIPGIVPIDGVELIDHRCQRVGVEHPP